MSSLTEASLRPNETVTLFFDPDDERGRWLKDTNSVTQPAVSALWRAACTALSPELALDIGANYGEISLPLRYRESQRVLLLEANPRIAGYLERSLATHAARERFTLFPVACSDRDGTATLNISPFWSGTSSLRDISHEAEGMVMSADVPMRSVDSIIAELGLKSPPSLLFKIDIEGYEGFALRGMKSLLDQVETLIGIIEFNRTYLDATGTDAAATFALLSEQGSIAAIDEEGGLQPVTDWRDLPEHCDLIVTRPAGLAERLDPALQSLRDSM